MDKDYGRRKPPRYAWIWLAMAGAFAAIALPIVGYIAFMGWRGADADARYWKIKGPPCPALTRAAFDSQPIRPGQAFHFEDVTFARAYGWSSCAEQPTQWGLKSLNICQFSNPGILKITTPKGEFYFAPGIGRPATVSATSEFARCVLGSNFQNEP